jgi:hypothetical protein
MSGPKVPKYEIEYREIEIVVCQSDVIDLSKSRHSKLIIQILYRCIDRKLPSGEDLCRQLPSFIICESFGLTN